MSEEQPEDYEVYVASLRDELVKRGKSFSQRWGSDTLESVGQAVLESRVSSRPSEASDTGSLKELEAKFDLMPGVWGTTSTPAMQTAAVIAKVKQDLLKPRQEEVSPSLAVALACAVFLMAMLLWQLKSRAQRQQTI